MKPLLIAALAAAPFTPADSSGTSTSTGHHDPLGFPEVTSELVIAAANAATGDSTFNAAHLVQAYSEVTRQAVTYSQETYQFLANTEVPVVGGLTIPADRVHATVEALLASRNFLLVPLTQKAPRLIQVVSMQTSDRNTVRGGAIFVDADHLEALEDHPAVLVTTTIALPNTDVRQLSNSMRTMITDANVQQMLPAGNSNSVVLTGLGTNVLRLARMLRQIDDASELPPRTTSGD